MNLFKSVFGFCLLGISIFCSGQTLYNVDPGFGQNGVAMANFGTTFESAVTSVQFPDGRLVLGGLARPGSENQIFLARFLPNGQPDLTFGTNGKLVISSDTNRPHSLASLIPLSDGRLIVCAGINLNNDMKRLVFRLNVNGQLDQSFGNQGFYLSPFEENEFLSGGSVLGNGGLWFFGTNRVLFNGQYYIRIVSFRLKENGRPDSSFNGGQYRVHKFRQNDDRYETPTSFFPYADGRVLLHGFSTATLNGNAVLFLSRLKPNGLPDSSFGQNGIFEYRFPGNNTSTVRSFVASNGRILLAGLHKQASNSISYPAVYAFKPNGGIDSSFGTNGMARLTYVTYNNNYLATDIKEDLQGRLYLSHYGYSENSTFRVFAVGRFLPNGQEDLSYGTGGAVATNIPGSVQRLHLDQVDGLPIVTGDTPLSTIATGTDMLAVKIKPGTTSVSGSLVSDFLLSPNPVRRGERIRVNGGKGGNFRLVTMEGREVPSENLDFRMEENGWSLQTRSLPEGLYVLRFQNAVTGRNSSHRFLVLGK